MIDWISVKDRLPEERKWYLGVCQHKTLINKTVSTIKEVYFYPETNKFSPDTITHWAEINLPNDVGQGERKK